MATERLIRVKDAEDAINRIGNQVKTARGMRVAALMSLCGVPTADAVPVVHGRWVELPTPREMWKYRCDKCGCPQDYEHNYCPNCGAKMDGDGN